MALDKISDEALNQAIGNTTDDGSVQFISDGVNVVTTTRTEMKAELAVRKLNKEVNTMVKYYDKAYIENIRHGMVFTSTSNVMWNDYVQTASVGGTVWPPVENFPESVWPPVENFPESVWPPVENFPESVGNRMVEFHETFLDRVYKFFDKFSIKFTTGVRDERVEQPSENSNAPNICPKRQPIDRFIGTIRRTWGRLLSS